MIYNLNGMVETPKFRENTHLCIHNNDLYENYPPHWHSAIEIIMPTENIYSVVVNDVTYVIKPYELLFVGSEVIHSTIAPPTGRRYFFQIDESRLRNIAAVDEILPYVGTVRHFTPENDPEIHRKLVKLFEEICDEYYESENANGEADILRSKNSDNKDSEISISTLCEPIIYGKFLTMLALIGKAQIEYDNPDSQYQIKKREYASKIMTVCDYIDEHFTEEITLEEVASKIGYSKFHFSRIFKKLTNMSFYKYVNQQRIKYAEELLSGTNLSISKISIQCGYSSTSAFIRMFKQLKECTPTDFRELREGYSFGAKKD